MRLLYLYIIPIYIYSSYDETFYIFFGTLLSGKTNKQTNKTATKLSKISLKIQLRRTFLIKLKLSEPFLGKNNILNFWVKIIF